MMSYWSLGQSMLRGVIAARLAPMVSIAAAVHIHVASSGSFTAAPLIRQIGFDPANNNIH